MANEEHLSILKQGVEVWNQWRADNFDVHIDLRGVNLRVTSLIGINLGRANLTGAHLAESNLTGADFSSADLVRGFLDSAILSETRFSAANLILANLGRANLYRADLRRANLTGTDLGGANLIGSNFSQAEVNATIFADLDLGEAIGLDDVVHRGPSSIGTDTIKKSKGKIPEVFLRGCGLSDTDIEYSKLFNPELSNEEINKILYKIYDLRASQAIQVFPLFISYSHDDKEFVDKIDRHLTKKGIRFWRDIHEMKAGRIETQIDKGIRQNPTVLLVLSEHSLKSDWVEHEVRTARELEKDMERDVLCPVALDDSWKNSRWPKRVMEQIMEYNILDFSAWKDDVKFEGMFRKLIDGLELFYKG